MPCKFSVEEILKITGGKISSGQFSGNVEGFGSDSRTDLTGKIFFALKGEQFDGHDYINGALDNGATVVISHCEDTFDCAVGSCVVKVADTLVALQQLANFWRKKLKAKVIGITGSNGKTTTKEYLKHILGQSHKVYANKGSFNNHWGVPFTLLEASLSDEFVITEMGMNHLGELRVLSDIAEQDISVVTNVGRAHVGEVGSIEKIALAKSEIYECSPQAQFIFNWDNSFTVEMSDRFFKAGDISFSEVNEKSTVFINVVESNFTGLQLEGRIGGMTGKALVPVFGVHNVNNVMAAASLALACGMSAEHIWQALPKIQGGWGRSELKIHEGVRIIFDAYNSNPESMEAVIHNVGELSSDLKQGAQKAFVFGDMLELGEESYQLHFELLQKLVENFDSIWYMGQHAKVFDEWLAASKFDKNLYISNAYEESLAIKLKTVLNPGDLVVIKGSRGMGLERVLNCWGVD